MADKGKSRSNLSSRAAAALKLSSRLAREVGALLAKENPCSTVGGKALAAGQ
jgi:hypothetical protein